MFILIPQEDARASSAANRAVELADDVGSVAVDPTLKLALIEALLVRGKLFLSNGR